MASPRARWRTSGSAYYSSIDPERMKGWVGLVGWPYSGWFTHISGHPSATGRAWDRESSPAKDRRSTTEPRSQQWLVGQMWTNIAPIWHKQTPSHTSQLAASLMKRAGIWRFVSFRNKACRLQMINRLWPCLTRQWRL